MNHVANESLKAIKFIYLSYYCGLLFFKEKRFILKCICINFCYSATIDLRNIQVVTVSITTCTSKRGCPAITDMLVLELNE